MPNVGFVRAELKAISPAYQTISDCVDGELAIKKAGDKYLPRPNAGDTSIENQTRYRAYKDRAVFYNVCQRTLAGLVGAIFADDPVIEVPAQLQAVVDNADGRGLSLTQLAKRSAYSVLSKGRAGVLVDYPQVSGPVSVADINAGIIRPTITVYEPSDIINWSTITSGSVTLLSLVVLRETYNYSDDGFELKTADQWRVLQLTEAGYAVSVWRKKSADYQMTKETIYPVGATGSSLSEIPFSFIGSENNDESIDNPPLYDIASLNISHYRNSADYEESCYMVGQPTPYFSGLTEEWVTDVLGGTIALGSRGAVPLPVGGTAGLLQATPNILPFEAMQHKERQMVSLGARLVEQSEVQRTATEAAIEDAADTSALASSAKNISAAFTWALGWCAAFAGASSDGIRFDLKTGVGMDRMTSQERSQLVAEWQGGAIAFTEMREALRSAGVATLPDDKARSLIDAELYLAPDISA